MKKEFYLILPNIRSCHNVGAMFRNADAFGVSKLFLVGWTATPPKPQIDKVSLGAETWMPWEKREDLEELLKELKKKGIVLVGLEQTEKSIDMADWQFDNISENTGIALVVGNEVYGVAPEIIDLCDVVVHIPMCGKKESLNVSVAAGVAMWEVSKRIK
jgi:23S rRNA (guanosine2251-2'-O)-methyltransferase